MKRLTSVFWFICIVNCSPYVLSKFSVEGGKPILDTFSWNISPFLFKQYEYSNCQNRYVVGVNIKFIESGGSRSNEVDMYDAVVKKITVELQDTSYSYSSNDWNCDADSVGKKFYAYMVYNRTEEEAMRLPNLADNINEVKVSCDVQYTSQKDGSFQRKEYSFKMIRDNEASGTSIFLK